MFSRYIFPMNHIYWFHDSVSNLSELPAQILLIGSALQTHLQAAILVFKCL